MDNLLELIQEQTRIYSTPERIEEAVTFCQKLTGTNNKGISYVSLLGNVYGAYQFVLDTYEYEQKEKDKNEIEEILENEYRIIIEKITKNLHQY